MARWTRRLQVPRQRTRSVSARTSKSRLQLLRPEPVLPQKLPDRHVNAIALLGREAAMLAAGDRDQLVGHFELVERFMQRDRLRIRYRRVRIAVHGEDGR